MTAYITCGMPALHDAMYDQLKGEPLICFDNGGDPPAALKDGLVLWTSPDNLGWGPGFNLVMDTIVRAYPGVDAVWLLNDDVQRVSPAMGRALYDEVMRHPDVCLIHPIHDMMKMEDGREAQPMLSVTGYSDFIAPMIRVDAWKAVGPLDIDLGIGWGLAMDWCYRARKLGLIPLSDGRWKLHHLGEQTCRAKGTYDKHALYPVDKFFAKHGVNMFEAIGADDAVRAWKPAC